MKRSNYCIDFEAIRKIDTNASNTYWHVLDQIYFMPWSEPDSELKKAIKLAPEGVRLFYLMGTIEGPVENGGFGQYFASRRPLHKQAKKTIAEFGFLEVVEFITEAEQYLKLNAKKLRAGMPWSDWAKVMGVVPMNKALHNIHGRFIRACRGLDDARETYLDEHRDKFE